MSNGDHPALPRRFVLELTMRCNHLCGHCSAVWGPPLAAAGESLEMTTAEVTDTVARLLDEVPVERIAVSGGEPLLREDLPEILAFLRRRDVAPTIVTNGRLLTPARLETLHEAEAFEITLFSHRRAVHDRMAGCAGSWDAALNAMANLRRANREFAAVFVACSSNWRDLARTVDLVVGLGAGGVIYNRVNFTPRTIVHGAGLLPDPQMIRENLDTLELAGEKYGLPIAVSAVIEPCVVDTRTYRNLHFHWCSRAGENACFTIDPSGNLRVCSHSPVVLGNIRDGGFTRLYYAHPHVTDFRESWPLDCADCESGLKSLCGGGCKAAAQHCYGTLRHVDPFVYWSREQRRLAADLSV